MAKFVSIWFGTLLAIALLVVAFWAWGLPSELIENSTRPYVAKLGLRSLSIALAAGAQVVLMFFVMARIYPTRMLDKIIGVGIAVVSFAALGVAIVLALSSR